MMRRLVVTSSLLVTVLAGPARPAAADCSGPTIRPIEPALRGEVITIRGYAFGDNCYDTGPPPEGEGTLGVPIPEVELFIAQGDGEVMVARGATGDDYEFAVDVTVPPRLAPGPARVIARWDPSSTIEQTFEVLADPPTAEPPGTTPIESFGSEPSPPTTTTVDRASTASSVPGGTTNDPGSVDEPAPWATEGSTGWIVAGVGVLALAVVAAVLVLARRRARAASSAEDR